MNDKKVTNEFERTSEGLIKGGFLDDATSLPYIGWLFNPLKKQYLELQERVESRRSTLSESDDKNTPSIEP